MAPRRKLLMSLARVLFTATSFWNYVLPVSCIRKSTHNAVVGKSIETTTVGRKETPRFLTINRSSVISMVERWDACAEKEHDGFYADHPFGRVYRYCRGGQTLRSFECVPEKVWNEKTKRCEHGLMFARDKSSMIALLVTTGSQGTGTEFNTASAIRRDTTPLPEHSDQRVTLPWRSSRKMLGLLESFAPSITPVVDCGCSELPDGYHQDASDCEYYCVCRRNVFSSRHQCGPGLYFDEDAKVCKRKALVKCPGVVLLPSNDAVPPSSPSEGMSPLPSYDAVSPISPTVQLVSHATARPTPSCCVGQADGYNRSPTSCRNFCICKRGRAVHRTPELSCPPGLLFSAKYKVCNWPRNVLCSDSDRKPPRGPGSACCAGNGDGYFQDPANCQRFCVCEKGEAKGYMRCPGRLRFDNNLKICDWPNKVKCGNSPTPRPPPVDCCFGKTDGYHQDPSSCNSFCTCSGGQNTMTLQCPAGLLFNEAMSTCEWAYNVTCIGNSPAPSNPLLKLTGGLRPYSANVVPSKMVTKAIKGQGAGQTLNAYSRHATVASWPISVDWRAVSGILTQIKEQGECGVCWAVAATTVIESAVAIILQQLAPNLSMQQVMDCVQGSGQGGKGSCHDGWPGDALAFAATNGGLSPAESYPFRGAISTPSCSFSGLMRVTAYEMVAPSEDDLMAAVAAQPVAVNIQSRVPSFLTYSQGIYNDPLCDNGLLDHTVVIVGYGTDSRTGVPFWILRNSWGPLWGENGYMRMARVGGRGICGITSMPGFYPVVKGPNPCSPINPCGGGSCVAVDSTSYSCQCRSGSIALPNSDGSPTCVPSDVCGSFALNPCGNGKCANDDRGGYTCECPDNFHPSPKADGSGPACIPNDGVTSQPFCTSFFNVPPGSNFTCDAIAAFSTLTVVDIMFMNPDLDCSENSPLIPQRICLSLTLPQLPSCPRIQWYTVKRGDTCAALYAKLYNNTPALFLVWNKRPCTKNNLLIGQVLCKPKK